MHSQDQNRWLVLAYTLPASPSRLRAAVWREVKRVGAAYLRDGVCVLPDRAETRPTVDALAIRIRHLGGAATAVCDGRLGANDQTRIVGELSRARAEEYREIAAEAVRFVAYLRQETQHRRLDNAEQGRIRADLVKLRRWIQQVIVRDHFGCPERTDTLASLERCDLALADLGRVSAAAVPAT